MGHGIEGDQVDFDGNSTKQGDQRSCHLLAIVDAVDESDFDCQPATWRQRISSKGLHQHLQRVASVDGKKACANSVVGGMKRDG